MGRSRAMPWRGQLGYARWSLRLNLVPYWRRAARWFVRISAAYLLAAILAFVAFEGEAEVFRLSFPHGGTTRQVVGVCVSWVLASWAFWAGCFFLVTLVAAEPRKSMGDYKTEYTGLVLRKDGSVLAQAAEVAVSASVWDGPVRFLRRSRFAWKLRSWPPRELVELMSTERPLVAPDGSGVWFHAATGYSVVLTKKGLVTWIERRDIRPDLIRYMERRGRTKQQTP